MANVVFTEKIRDLHLENILINSSILYDEPMSKHTSFRTGGIADCFIKIGSEEDLIKLMNIEEIRNKIIPIYIVGNGTNLLVKDSGIAGIVVKLDIRKYSIINDNMIYAESGVSNGVLANFLLENELSGFEFASGIPGTIGGAIYMNAGAYGSEIKDVLLAVRYYDINLNKIVEIDSKDLNLGYRYSRFQEDMNGIILSGKFKFINGNKLDIKSKMNEYMARRLASQPLEYPSAGSTFKRMDSFITAKAIEEAGLKGYTIGGAMVSNKHAGFIINTGNATSQDILDLIHYVQKVILEKYNKKIEPEVRIIGR